MSKRTSSSLPASLSQLHRRLDQWRRGHRRGARLPDMLWSAAVRAARSHGLNKTARLLRLDYYSLKKRVQAAGGGPTVGTKAAPTFVEFVSAEGSSVGPECTLEFEGGNGAKMRMQLRGGTVPDIGACLSAFGLSAAGPSNRRRRNGKL